jgi:hypothetical protein
MENDPKADQYLEIVLASMDYDAFYHLMKAMRGRAAAERVAESKASSREEQDETKPTSKTTTTSVTSSIANKNERRIGSKLTLDQSEDPQENRIEDAKEQDKEEKKIHDIKEIISQSKEEK